ncbi:MAG: hypothetical protein ACR2KJ_11200 [Jatrophihabitans sp.]
MILYLSESTDRRQQGVYDGVRHGQREVALFLGYLVRGLRVGGPCGFCGHVAADRGRDLVELLRELDEFRGH